MEHIVAGHFQEQQHVDKTVKALTAAGFARPKLAPFYLTPQHKEPATDNRARKATGNGFSGTLAGLAAGAIAGATAIPIIGASGPMIGVLAGAYVGSLAGGLSEIEEDRQASEDPVIADHPQRQAGWMLAVAVADHAQEDIAFDILQRSGAQDIEEASGTITNGRWRGFDPLRPVKPVKRL